MSNPVVADTASRLLHWFKTNGGFLNDNLTLQHTAEFGYHFIASSAIEPDTTACTCPMSLTLSHLNCVPTPPHGITSVASSSVCARLVGRVAPTIVAVFLLAEQRLRGPASFWHPYIAALPAEADLTTPLYFTDPLDLVWLYGSNLYADPAEPRLSAVERRRDLYREAWSAGVAALVAQGADPAPFTWDLCLWAATILSSRSFASTVFFTDATPATAASAADEVPQTTSSYPILYPVLDIFNHRFREPVSWSLSGVPSGFTLTLRAHIPATHQVFNNYAPKSNEELLLAYGFSLPHNPADHVAVRLRGRPDPFYLRGAAHYAGPYAGTAALGLGGVPGPLLGAVRELSEDGRGVVEAWADTVAVVGAMVRRRREAMEMWDAQLGDGGRVAGNRRQEAARVYREGQIGILREVEEQIEGVLGRLEDGLADVEEVFGAFTVDGE